ncbi:hypothetical protein BX070DRAFT_221378 [Coemansia spiralis]|nr:hypothetical protein BX070DRAFT_221378 [Coemansia spiralis]
MFLLLRFRTQQKKANLKVRMTATLTVCLVVPWMTVIALLIGSRKPNRRIHRQAAALVCLHPACLCQRLLLLLLQAFFSKFVFCFI